MGFLLTDQDFGGDEEDACDDQSDDGPHVDDEVNVEIG
jgi:hypothetical protein